jgi:predicted regulator of Ras-like GTPase activity (Roadblock/LC7/MglB family)
MVAIESLLTELVSSLDAATGAIIVGGDGEAVLWGVSQQSERLRLRGAYVAVVMKTFRAASARAGLGNLKHLVVEYDGATVIVQEIDDDCSVVLELRPNAVVGRAVYRLQLMAERLRTEFAA